MFYEGLKEFLEFPKNSRQMQTPNLYNVVCSIIAQEIITMIAFKIQSFDCWMGNTPKEKIWTKKHSTASNDTGDISPGIPIRG